VSGDSDVAGALSSKLGRASRYHGAVHAALMGIKPDMVISATFLIDCFGPRCWCDVDCANYGVAPHRNFPTYWPEGLYRCGVGGISNLGGAMVVRAVDTGYR
jgi:hypothetical protein